MRIEFVQKWREYAHVRTCVRVPARSTLDGRTEVKTLRCWPGSKEERIQGRIIMVRFLS